MPVQWFGQGNRSSVDDLLARQNYGKAIELIKRELQRRRKDPHLRLQLGDVLLLSGRPKEAVEIYAGLADDLALGGFAAKAIAVLKKVQAIQPGNPDVEEKLASLINQQQADELPESQPAPAPVADPVPAPAQSEPLSEEAVRNQLVALIEEALTPSSGTAAAAEQGNYPVVETPLFRDFSREELVAVIRGLRLLTFEPGEILVTEGETGDSLFVLTTGWVRAYVRQASGASAQVRELKEGDFFGEISLLRGGVRTATITAGTHCELLELDKPTLDAIAQAHPHVLEVLQEFYDQRAGTTLETMVRGNHPLAL